MLMLWHDSYSCLTGTNRNVWSNYQPPPPPPPPLHTSLAGVLMKTLEAAAEDKTWLLIKSNYQMFVRLCPGSTVGGWRAVKTKILSPKLYPAYHYGLSREGPPLCRLQPALQDSVNQWPANRKARYLPFFSTEINLVILSSHCGTRLVTSLRTWEKIHTKNVGQVYNEI